MTKQSHLQTVSSECRAILRAPCYSPEKAAKLIEWLHDENAAVADLAGRALAAMGSRAFDDLLQHVRGAAPWPTAVWTLGLFPDCHDQFLPLLRKWLAQAAGELQRQCAVSLAHVLVNRCREGHPVEAADLVACHQVLERDAKCRPAIRVHLRALEKALRVE